MAKAKSVKKIAEKIADTLPQQAAKSASKELTTAQKILERIDTPEKAVALTGQERAEYLRALDEVYGDRAKRAKDLGFDTKVFHGTNRNLPDKFDPAKSEYAYPAFVTKDPKTAEYFAQRKVVQVGDASDPQVHSLLLRGKPKDPKKLLEKYKFIGENGDFELDPKNSWQVVEKPKVKAALDKEGLKNPYVTEQIESEGYPGWINQEEMSGRTRVSKNIAVSDPKDLRSTNAAFDPRFKDSPYLLSAVPTAGQANRNAVNKILDQLGTVGGKAYQAYNDYVAEPTSRAIQALVTDPVSEATKLSQYAGQIPQAQRALQDAEAGQREGLQFAGEMTLDPLNVVPGLGAARKAASLAPKVAQRVTQVASKIDALPSKLRVNELAAKILKQRQLQRAVGPDNIVPAAAVNVSPDVSPEAVQRLQNLGVKVSQ